MGDTDMYLNTFLFTEPYGRDPVHCRTTISVVNEDNTYTTTPCWKLKLESEYSNGKKIVDYKDALERGSHPLTQIKDNKSISHFKGFTVIKNEMTTKMIDYLMMDDTELSKYTGTTTPQEFRRKILHSLIQFTE